MVEKNKRNRLTQIDALRGLAAIAVVLFHYTFKFNEIFSPSSAPTFTFAQGHYGVNLFFIISGFVIFMTLEKTARPLDFLVSRFSRLYPAYWFAIAFTTSVLLLWPLPNQETHFTSVALNALMFHGFFGVPHVDGVYWTLEVELLFYMLVFAIYRLRLLPRIDYFLCGLIILKIAYFAFDVWFSMKLPGSISRVFILRYVPWFALGISIYKLTGSSTNKSRFPWITVALSLAGLLITDGAGIFFLAIFFSLLVALAACSKLRFLEARLFVWLGAISYPLYLLHQNVGWTLLLQSLERGLGIDVAVIGVLLLMLFSATMVSIAVEQPAMKWIRREYAAYKMS